MYLSSFIFTLALLLLATSVRPFITHVTCPRALRVARRNGAAQREANAL